MAKKRMDTFAKQYALAICDANEVLTTMESEPEKALLLEHNPNLYYAYIRLLQIAYPKDGRWLL